jgi:hypothetical protein
LVGRAFDPKHGELANEFQLTGSRIIRKAKTVLAAAIGVTPHLLWLWLWYPVAKGLRSAAANAGG